MPYEDENDIASPLPSARHTYDLFTNGDGTVSGRAWTNDNLDRGYPSEDADWEVKYTSREEAQKSTGGTHRGINGCFVEVLLDGEPLLSLAEEQRRNRRPSP